MTLQLKLPGQMSASAGLPKSYNYVTALAGDSRVAGIWRLNEEFATLSGSDVSSFANLKTGGPALVSTSYQGPLVLDPYLGRKVLRADEAAKWGTANDVQYTATINGADVDGGLTACTVLRPYGTSDRIMTVDCATQITMDPILASSERRMRGQIGSTDADVALTGDTKSLRHVALVAKDGVGIETHVSGEPAADVEADATVDVSGATTFTLGSQNAALAPTAEFDLAVLFWVNIFDAAHAELLTIYEAFLGELYPNTYPAISAKQVTG